MFHKVEKVQCRKCDHKYRPKEFIAKSVIPLKGYGWKTTTSTICPKCGHEN